MTIAAPLLFLRHGETSWNAQGRYQGSTDTVLSDAGRNRARDHARLVLDLCATGDFDERSLSITTSPLRRARDTAEMLQAGLATAPGRTPPKRIDHRLRELSFGRWEGLTSMEVKARFYEERKSRKRDRYTFAPDGGDSMAGRREEVVAALADLAPHTIIVTHSQIIRLVALILNADAAAVTMDVPHEGGFRWNGARLKPVLSHP